MYSTHFYLLQQRFAWFVYFRIWCDLNFQWCPFLDAIKRKRKRVVGVEEEGEGGETGPDCEQPNQVNFVCGTARPQKWEENGKESSDAWSASSSSVMKAKREGGQKRGMTEEEGEGYTEGREEKRGERQREITKILKSSRCRWQRWRRLAMPLENQLEAHSHTHTYTHTHTHSHTDTLPSICIWPMIFKCVATHNFIYFSILLPSFGTNSSFGLFPSHFSSLCPCRPLSSPHFPRPSLLSATLSASLSTLLAYELRLLW